METARVGRSGLKVSRLCLGTMMFGGPADEAASLRIIDRAIEVGIDFLDSADVYQGGESERVTGKALKGRRDQIVLATKVCNPTGPGANDVGTSRRHILAGLEDSLERLATDYIDIYYLHRPDYETPIEESLAALDDCVRQGKVRYIGCSNYYSWQLCEAIWTSRLNRYAAFTCIQPLYNVLNRDIELELLPLCADYGVGVIPYSPLARGVLAGKYQPGAAHPEGSRAARGDKRIHETELREERIHAVFPVVEGLRPVAEGKGATLTQFALAWVLANPIVSSAIIGPRTMEQLEDNLGALDITITPEDEKTVDRLNPPGEHTGIGFNDPNYPVRGRQLNIAHNSH